VKYHIKKKLSLIMRGRRDPPDGVVDAATP
jgi:hypothetical protein